MNCLAIRLSGKFVFLILILEVSNVVVANADCSIVLAIELATSFRQVDHLIDVSHLDSSCVTLDELVLRQQTSEGAIEFDDLCACAFIPNLELDFLKR